MIDTPKNLTRNILIGLILGFVVGSFLFYTDFLPSQIDDFIEKYIFKLGGDIFMNLLKLLVVPLVFFSLVSGISSLGKEQSLGKLTFKDCWILFANNCHSSIFSTSCRFAL